MFPPGLGIKNAQNLFDGLAGAEYDFGQSLANLPMVVNTGEPQILERQVTQFIYGLLDADFALFDLLEQLFDLFCLDESPHSKKRVNLNSS